jgi:hypothetical protein
MNLKPPKKVWKIQVTEDGKFVLVDELDVVRSREQSRHKLFELATEGGADEVKHDYDNVKYP